MLDHSTASENFISSDVTNKTNETNNEQVKTNTEENHSTVILEESMEIETNDKTEVKQEAINQTEPDLNKGPQDKSTINKITSINTNTEVGEKMEVKTEPVDEFMDNADSPEYPLIISANTGTIASDQDNNIVSNGPPADVVTED